MATERAAGASPGAQAAARPTRRSTRYVPRKGTVTHVGKQGLNRVRFMGRLRGKALARGRYRLVAVARDAAGNASKCKRVAFRIIR